MALSECGRRRAAEYTPSNRCVLPEPVGPWINSGVRLPGRSATICAEACANRFVCPTTNESSVAKRRRLIGSAAAPWLLPLVALFAETSCVTALTLARFARWSRSVAGLACATSASASVCMSLADCEWQGCEAAQRGCWAVSDSSTRNSTDAASPSAAPQADSIWRR